MFDFIKEGAVPLLYYCFYWISILIVYIIVYKGLKSPILIDDRKRTFGFIVFFILFSTTYMVGNDYFQYREYVKNPMVWFNEFGHEMVYQKLYLLCKGNYEFFRLIVWGTSICIVALISKLFRLPTYYVLLFWFFFFCDKICYARATLGMAIFFWGLGYLLKGKNFIKNYGLGLLLIFLSLSFHRSILMIVSLLPFLFIKVTKRTFIPYSIIILVCCVNILIFSGLEDGVLNSYLDEGGISRLENYSDLMLSGEGGWAKVNILGLIMNNISYLFFYVIFIWVSVYFLKERSLVETPCFKLFKITWGIFILSTSFLIVYGLNNPFFYRCLFMSHIPLSVCFSYLFVNHLIRKKLTLFALNYAFFLHTMILIDALN